MKVPPITEGMTRKGGRNQGPSQVEQRPDPPGRIYGSVTGRVSSSSSSLKELCRQCGAVTQWFDPREPSAGFYWMRRSDGQYVIGEVVDNQGRKSVRFFGDSRNQLGLSMVHENFKFIQRLEPPSG